MADDLSPEAIKLIRDTVRDAMGHGGPVPMRGVHRVPEDERLHVMIKEIVERELAGFEKRVEAIVNKSIKDTCTRLGLQIDDNHIIETNQQITGALRTQRNLSRLATWLSVTIGGGIVLGVLKLLGLDLDHFGGGRP